MRDRPCRGGGRFQLNLLQLVLVTLTVGAVSWLNAEFVRPGPYYCMSRYETHEYGWPFTFWLSEEVYAVAEERTLGEPEAEAIRYRTWDGGPYPGLQFFGLFFDLVSWGIPIVLALVIGDQSSLPRSVRDRLRRVKYRSAKDGEPSVGQPV